MDNNLKCDAGNCVHNRNRLCNAREIEVQGDETRNGSATFCGTFAERSLQNYAGAFTNMNIGESLRSLVSDDQLDPSVACTAHNCVYNRDHYCQAENVQITNEAANTAPETECQTFRPQ